LGDAQNKNTLNFFKIIQFAIDKNNYNKQIILVVYFPKSTILAVIIPKNKIAMNTSLSQLD
jgi:hypothetical protein